MLVAAVVVEVGVAGRRLGNAGELLGGVVLVRQCQMDGRAGPVGDAAQLN